MYNATYIASIRARLAQWDSETIAKQLGCSVALARAVRAASRAPLCVGSATLTPAQVAAMRAMRAMGVTASGVAVAFGRGQSQVQRACSGATYKPKRRKRCPHCGKFVD